MLAEAYTAAEQGDHAPLELASPNPHPSPNSHPHPHPNPHPHPHPHPSPKPSPNPNQATTRRSRSCARSSPRPSTSTPSTRSATTGARRAGAAAEGRDLLHELILVGAPGSTARAVGPAGVPPAAHPAPDRARARMLRNMMSPTVNPCLNWQAVGDGDQAFDAWRAGCSGTPPHTLKPRALPVRRGMMIFGPFGLSVAHCPRERSWIHASISCRTHQSCHFMFHWVHVFISWHTHINHTTKFFPLTYLSERGTASPHAPRAHPRPPPAPRPSATSFLHFFAPHVKYPATGLTSGPD